MHERPSTLKKRRLIDDLWVEMNEIPPERVARHTVEQNGGEYITTVSDLLALFGRQNLTDGARAEIRDALGRSGVGTEPQLDRVERTDRVRLFLVQHQAAPLVTSGRSSWAWLRPRTWKGWLGYAAVAFVVIVAIVGGSEEERSSDRAPERPPVAATPADSSAQETARQDAQVRARQAAARREARVRARRAAARREREQRARAVRADQRRERIRARRAVIREERAQAAAERERQAQAAAAAEQEAASSCHPSYDPCLNPAASDYDCAGGSGDGPEYTGYVTVTGSDDYDLDRDGDGTGCES